METQHPSNKKKELLDKQAELMKAREHAEKIAELLDEELVQVHAEIKKVCDHINLDGTSAVMDAMYLVCRICGESW